MTIVRSVAPAALLIGQNLAISIPGPKLTRPWKYCTLEAMTDPSQSQPIDGRLKEQAQELQALLTQLLEPPLDLVTHGLADMEMSPREVKAVMLLGTHGQMIMTDLAASLQAPLSTVTRVVDRLEKKHMVVRARSEEDRRVVAVRTGEKGHILHEIIQQSRMAMASRMLAPLTQGEREILLELIGKLIRASGTAER
ncbi:MarR family winged helix-turn-helix transcriptional regulator [Paludibaculum fermentans]|uniref:MarR family winged helix-turn-helix transcriptional regulator n=1 Tax=Paludibaculum fermentans TaxID=1473598 RepID=UPI003EB91261